MDAFTVITVVGGAYFTLRFKGITDSIETNKLETNETISNHKHAAEVRLKELIERVESELDELAELRLANDRTFYARLEVVNKQLTRIETILTIKGIDLPIAGDNHGNNNTDK